MVVMELLLLGVVRDKSDLLSRWMCHDVNGHNVRDNAIQNKLIGAKMLLVSIIVYTLGLQNAF